MMGTKTHLADIEEIVELANCLTSRYLANRTHDPKYWFISCITPDAHGREKLMNQLPHKGKESVAAMWVRMHDLLEKVRT